jgi:hypothetical protein
MAEAAQQELRPPFRVPQSIFLEPDCQMGSLMIFYRWKSVLGLFVSNYVLVMTSGELTQNMALSG